MEEGEVGGLLALELLENLKTMSAEAMKADLADLTIALVIGSDTEFRIIIFLGDIIFRAKHGTLEEMETDSVFLLKCWHLDLARTAFIGMRPEE